MFGMDLEANACVSSISKVGVTKYKSSSMIDQMNFSEKWFIYTVKESKCFREQHNR